MDLTVAGERIYAATGGRAFVAGKPAVVFLHGAGMDHTVWALQTRYFAHHGWNVLAFDLPAHGRSEGAARTSVGALADWVVQALDAAGLAKAALVGHSMGALVALDCAARYPDRVDRVALLGAAPRMPVHPDLLAAAAADDPRAYDLITDWGHGRTGHLGGNRAPGLWVLGGAVRLLQRARPGVLSVDLEACNAYDAAEALAPRIAAPAVLLLGAQDRMTPPRAGQKLAALIPGARAQVLHGAGHMMMVEQPDDTLDALKAALAG